MNNANTARTNKYQINDLINNPNIPKNVSLDLYRKGVQKTNGKIKKSDTISKLGIGVQNVNGISEEVKRRAIMLNLIQYEFNIICLISTKIRKSLEHQIMEENNLTHDIIFNSKGNSNGLLVMISKKLNIKYDVLYKDELATQIFIKFSFDNHTFLAVFYYGPSDEDNPEFHRKLHVKANEYGFSKFFLVGDANVCLDMNKDSEFYVTNPKPLARELILNEIEENLLIDPVIYYQQYRPHYTYVSYDKYNKTYRNFIKSTATYDENKEIPKKSRLDYFLVSPSLATFMINYQTLDIYRSDHAPIGLWLDFARFKPGPGYMKTNDKDHSDPKYQEGMIQVFKNAIAKHIIYKENLTFFDHRVDENTYLDFINNIDWDKIWYSEFTSPIDEFLFWFQNDIKLFDHSFQKEKSQNINKDLNLLSKKLTYAHLVYKKDRCDETKLNNYLQAKEEYETKLDIKLARTFHDNKINKNLEGDRATKQFFSYKQKAASHKYISQLYVTKEVLDEAGNIVLENGSPKTIQVLSHNTQEINNEMPEYFTKTYKKQDHTDSGKIEAFVNTNLIPKLKENDKEELEGEITIDELKQVLDGTKKDSSPGMSGLTFSFYKTFWDQLKHLVKIIADHSFQTGSLPEVLRQGVISLLPKGDKDKRHLSNLRPLTLLNCMYKLISGVISARLNSKLPQLISVDQNGFVKGRSIQESLRNTYDIINYVNSKKIKSIILLIDFKKAFDTISHKFVLKSLEVFNFGNNIIKWVEILLSNFQVCCNNGGHLSGNFLLGRGSKQGDPVSTALFILCIEILAIKLKHAGIIGINVRNKKSLISLFADDITLFLKHDKENLRNVINILKEFKHYSGLEIQTQKTIACTVGAGKNIVEKNIICKEEGLQWSDKFTLLGVDFNANLDDMNHNINNKINTWSNIIKHWSYKKCTPLGRANVVRTFLLSKLNHIALVYPVIDNLDIDELEKSIYKFIWGGTAHVLRQDAKASFRAGGLNMPDLITSLNSFNVSWLRRIKNGMDSEATWINTFKDMLIEYSNGRKIEDFFLLGTKGIRAFKENCDNKFWKCTLQSIYEILPIFHTNHIDNLMNANIWANNTFTSTKGNFKGKKAENIEKNKLEIHAYELATLKNKGKRYFKYPRELIGIDNKGVNYFLSYEEAKEKFKFNNNCKADYNKVVDIIKDIIEENNLFLFQFDPFCPAIPSLYKLAILQEKGCNQYTKLFKTKIDKEIVEGNKEREKKWKTEFGMDDNQLFGLDFWNNNFRRIKTIKCSMYLRLLQYKINRGCLQVNGFQAKNYRSDGLCRFCESEIETTSHIFWDCPKVEKFREEINSYFHIFWPVNIDNISRFEMLFGISNETFQTPKNFLLLLIKEYIWKTLCKGTKLSKKQFIRWFSYEIKIWQIVNDLGGKPVGLDFLKTPDYLDAISVIYPHKSIYDGHYSEIDNIVYRIEMNFYTDKINDFTSNSDDNILA